MAADAAGRAVRSDGFTPARQRRFLAALSACGVAADPIRQDVDDPASGPARAVAEFLLRFLPQSPPPEPSPPAEPEAVGFEVWEDEDRGGWVTNFRPPIGFEGFEYGEWEECDYCRELSPEEQAVIDAGVAVVQAEEAAEREAELAAARAARDRAFGFVPASEREGKGGKTAAEEDPSRHSRESGNPAAVVVARAGQAEGKVDPRLRRDDGA